MKTKASIQFGFVDVTAKADSGLTVNNQQEFVNLEDLKKDDIVETKYGTLERNQFALDGSFELMPDNLKNMCWWSKQMSDESGNFETPLTLEIDFTESHSSLGLTFLFSETGDYCNNLNIKYYDKDNILISNVNFSPDNVKYVANNIVENYTKIVITFYSTNNPCRYLKLYQILYGAEKTFEGDSLKSASILEEVDLLSSEIPINTLDFTIYSADDDFNILNPQGVYTLLQQRQKLEVTEILIKENKRIPMGTFYLDTWKNKNDKQMDISAIDLVGVIDKTDFSGGIYQNITAANLLKEIFTSAGLSSDDYEIQEDLKTIILNGYLPICTHRKALQQVVFAIGAVSDCSRGSKIRIYTVEDVEKVEDREIIDKNNRFQNTLEIKQNEIVTGVSVNAHNYTKTTTQEKLYEGVLDKGKTTIKFNDPVYNISCTGGTIVEFNCNYAIISCTAESNVVINGYKYEDNIQEYLVELENSSDNDTKNILKIENAYLVSKSNAKTIATKILEYYKETYTTSLEFLLGDEILTQDLEVDQSYNKLLVGHANKFDIDLTGGFIVKAELNTRIRLAYEKRTLDLAENIGATLVRNTYTYLEGESE